MRQKPLYRRNRPQNKIPKNMSSYLKTQGVADAQKFLSSLVKAKVTINDMSDFSYKSLLELHKLISTSHELLVKLLDLESDFLKLVEENRTARKVVLKIPYKYQVLVNPIRFSGGEFITKDAWQRTLEALPWCEPMDVGKSTDKSKADKLLRRYQQGKQLGSKVVISSIKSEAKRVRSPREKQAARIVDEFVANSGIHRNFWENAAQTIGESLHNMQAQAVEKGDAWLLETLHLVESKLKAKYDTLLKGDLGKRLMFWAGDSGPFDPWLAQETVRKILALHRVGPGSMSELVDAFDNLSFADPQPIIDYCQWIDELFFEYVTKPQIVRAKKLKAIEEEKVAEEQARLAQLRAYYLVAERPSTEGRQGIEDRNPFRGIIKWTSQPNSSGNVWL